MQASAIRLRPLGGNVLAIPSRTTLDILSACAQGCLALALSPIKREECLDLLNKNTINAPVLGIPLTLALYHELNSPLVEQKGKIVEEFLSGVRGALEQYHDSYCLVGNELYDEKDTSEEWMKVLQSPDQDITSALSWKKDAEENPDSPKGELLRMLTPQHFSEYELQAKMAKLMMSSANFPEGVSNADVRYVPDSTTIPNIALLSVRALTMPPTPVLNENVEELNEADGKKNDDILNQIYTDDMPVLAQIEVLYDMDQSFTVPAKASSEDDDGSTDEGEKKQDRSSVFVGVFEAWFHGSPDGLNVRWKVAQHRPAWEFQ